MSDPERPRSYWANLGPVPAEAPAPGPDVPESEFVQLTSFWEEHERRETQRLAGAPGRGGKARGRQRRAEKEKRYRDLRGEALAIHKDLSSWPYPVVRARIVKRHEADDGVSADTVDRATESIPDRDSWGKG